MESFVSPKCCLVDWFHQYFFCLVRVPAKSVTSLQLKLYFMIRKRQLFPFVFFLLMGSFFPRGRLLNRTCFYYFDANFADAITSRHQKLSRCNPAFKDSTSVLAYHSRCFSQTSWLRNPTALPQTLEELKEILAKDKDQVDEELWRNAIKIEYEFLRYENADVPVVMTDEMWERAFAENSSASRRRLFKLFWLKEGFKVKKKERQAKNQARREKRAADEPADASADSMRYIPMKKISDSLIKRDHQLNLDFAHRFGQPLVFDLGQDYHMNSEESNSFVNQMRDIYSLNRAQWEPFQLHLCNYNPQSPGHRDIIESEEYGGYLWNVSEDCFTRLFPPERIVYLSPDAPEVATEWRHDDVYVIGGVVDKTGVGGTMTLSKIKRLGLRSVRFDIDRYFKKKQAPLLTLDVVFAALLDARDTDGNWLYSYRHFPRRMVRWRPEFAFMERVENINSPNVSRIYQNYRHIFKPRRTQPPYCDHLSRNGEDSDDDWK